MKYDLPQTTQFRTDCVRYQLLITKNSRTALEDTELATLATTLADYMIKASDWNVLEANVNNHLTNASNPHNVTTTQIGAETPTGAQAKVNVHIAAADPHPQYATDIDLSTHAGLTNPHSATSLPTANRIPIRDGSGRAQFADPASAQDAATKAYVDSKVASVSGVYTGDGAVTRDLALTFTPTIVHVIGIDKYATATFNGLDSSGNITLQVGTNKMVVKVTGSSGNANTVGTVYYYIAYR